MEQPVNPASEVQQPARPARKPWAADRRERRLLPLSLLLAYLFEIGRASCWERVCQFV